MYKMINEELRIASCGIDEIPGEFVEEIKPLETLTMYYDPNCDMVVLNQDNKDYDSYKGLCFAYLDIDHSTRERLKDEFKSFSNSNYTDVLDYVISLRERKRREEKYKELDKILGNTSIDIVLENIDMINDIGENRAGFWRDSDIFIYGYIMGKRAERARRKKNIRV